MSAQDRPEGIEPNLSREIRAHARGDRQRTRVKLRPGVTVDQDLDDPGVGYRKPHHRWHDRPVGNGRRPGERWKRRRQEQQRAARRRRSQPTG